MSKVLIADHHPISQKGISSILESETDITYNIVGYITDGNDLLSTLTSKDVDILILEIDIPNLNSITALKKIRKESLSERLVHEGNTTQGLAFKYKKLSSREIEVLNLLSNGKRNKEIAHDLEINEKTVSTYKMRLLKKLEAQNVAELIKHARLLQSSHI